MDCPRCKRPMIVVELDQIEIDHCVHCRGSWLDAGELELLLDDASNREDLLSRIRQGAETGEAARRCPICEKKMDKISYELDDGRVMLDACTRSDGLWFDKGELAEVLRHGTFPAGNDIYKLLKDIFSDAD